MSSILPQRVNDLIGVFSKLPGVGPKMASRLTFYLLQRGKADVQELAAAISNITEELQACERCGLITDAELCSICLNSKRQSELICVVEDSLDVVAFERSGMYHGLYHVLGGVLSPIEGIGPEQLRVTTLLERVQQSAEPVEVILAMNPSIEGEATATYLKEQLDGLESGCAVTRIARGLPMGSDVEYADPTTLVRALEGRRELI
ncbi:MAG: recombination mediator RecR [bacterium]|nr:recombination mediator RecR [bacterium]